MKTIAIDFETYYDTSFGIRTQGTDGYIQDPRFDAYLVSVYCPGEINYVGHPRDFDWDSIAGNHAIAHNARFDQAVFNQLVRDDIVPDNLNLTWSCTADLLAYHHCARSLASGAKIFLDKIISKKVRSDMKGKRFRDLNAEETEALLKYAMDDAVLCYDLWEKLSPTWPPLEQRLSRFNRDRGLEGIRVDLPLLRQYIDRMEEVRLDAARDIPWEWDPDKTPLSRKQLINECRKTGIPAPSSTAQDNPACAEWEETYGKDYPWVSALRQWRKANILLSRLRHIERALRGDRFPFHLMYFGAHTGRFSGSSGFNMQNMPRDPFMGVNLRNLFVAPDGKVLLIADFSQIEPRAMATLVRDKEMLQQIRDGVSVYEAHARATMGWEDGVLADEDPDTYRLAKARVLGLGYGCGHVRFVAVAWKLAKLEISLEESKQIVKDFRLNNPKITHFWRELQTSAQWSSNEDDRTFEIELPSGRSLCYYDLQRLPYFSGEIVRDGRRAGLFGGKLAENVIQAVARDIYVEKLMDLWDAGLLSRFDAHDEYVIEGQESDAPKILEILSAPVSWLPNCPIDATVDISHYYKK